MPQNADNPCLICSVDQQCCSRLSGLRLSEEEFRKYFRDHSAKLSVLKYNKMFIVSTPDSRPCPHWQKSGCTIYADRPADCRLYPFEIKKISDKDSHVEVTFGENPGCPQKESLLMPIEEAKGLITIFCRAVYGREKKIDITYIQGHGGRPWIFRLFDPLIAWLSHKMRRY